jgi:hypothetical protein
MMFILFYLFTVIDSCHPECLYECNVPVCPAVCVPITIPPSCEACINHTNPLKCYNVDNDCYIHCPPNQCEQDSCPVCEVICSPDICNNIPNCFVECEETQSSWYCRKPTSIECPPPVCILQCEQPACAFSISSKIEIPINLLFMLLILAIHL